MVVASRSHSQRWLLSLTATSVLLFLLYILANPSVPVRAKDYVVSHLPLQTHISTAEKTVESMFTSQITTTDGASSSPRPSSAASSPSTRPSTTAKPPSTLLTLTSTATTLSAKTSSPTATGADAVATSSETPAYDTIKWFWQVDIDGYPLPEFKIPLDELRNYPPHNYKGHGQQVYATFFATRNGTMKDPYFLSALQIVYRLLWDKDIKGTRPVVVFVPPFVPAEQRAYFAAVGAMVREVDVREFTPNDRNVIPERLKDMFTKLEMWRHTDFDRIMYLDSDAIPFRSLDGIWDLAKTRKCKFDRLPKEDKTYGSTVCEYVFAAWPEDFNGMLNAGVMVIKPTMPMYTRLVRESLKPHKWDEGIMEQAFLDKMFNYGSPFPSTNLSVEWNSVMKPKNPKLDPRVVHGKLWSLTFMGSIVPEDLQWIVTDYEQKWAESVTFYESDEFMEMRKADLQAIVGASKASKVTMQDKSGELDKAHGEGP